MSNETRDQLRVVAAEEPSASFQPTPVGPDWEKLCTAFAESTRVALEFSPMGAAPAPTPVWQCEIPGLGDQPAGQLLLRDPVDRRLAKKRAAAAESLAVELGQLIHDVHAAQRALQQREAELATAIPVLLQPNEETQRLADRLCASLKAAASVVSGRAAALYLLDDDTAFLNLRAHWGLNNQCFTQPPRPLRGARADLEALAGHAVTLHDLTQFEPWNVPEACVAAVCVPVSSASIPLGTLWVFGDTPHDFTDAEVNVLEIVAGGIAAELEREVVLREHGCLGSPPQQDTAVEWQRGLFPPPLTHMQNWSVAVRPSLRSHIHGDAAAWFVDLADRIHVTLTTAHDRSLAGALTAAKVAGAIHADISQLKTPEERLCRLDEVLSTSSAGDQCVSGFSAVLDESHGTVEFTKSGHVDAFAIRPHGWEPLTSVDDDPTPLGDADWMPPGGRTHEFEPGDTLLVMTSRPRRKLRVTPEKTLDASSYAEALLHHTHLNPEEMTTLLASLWEPGQTPWDEPPAIFVARREMLANE